MVSVQLAIKVVPGASRTGLAGWYGDALKIRVAAPPEKGKANKAVLRLLAESLELPLSAFEIASGHTSAHKVILIKGLSEEKLASRLPPRP